MRPVAVVLTLTFAAAALADDKPSGFTPLFNGRNLDGWKERQVKGKGGFWSVEDGILKAKPGTGWLGTEEQYGDFVLRVEWKIAKNGNSGVFFRVPDREFTGSPSDAGFEIQILDDNNPQYANGKLKPYQYCGGLYHFQPISKPVFKGADVWQSYELTVKGDHISLVFNGEHVLDADISKSLEMQKRPKKGFIGLQNHGSAVEFRKVEIKELGQ